MTSKPRLLCIPGAGASAARFERLRPALANLVELRTFELPGRGIRFAEPSLPLLTDHVTHFVRHVEAEPYQRWILAGESLGALTATWLARALADSMRAEVTGMITVAAAPRVTGNRPRREVIELLRADAIALDGETVAMAGDTQAGVTKAVLADIDAAHAVGRPLQLRPIDIVLATIRGSDDGLISAEAAQEWEGLARAGWLYREVPGNHYQFEQPTPELIDAIIDAIGFISPTLVGRTSPEVLR